MDIIDKIASVQTGQADKPVEDIPMTFKVDRIRKEEITKSTAITILSNEDPCYRFKWSCR